MPADRRMALLTPVLIFVSLVAAVVSSLGAPLVPSIAEQLEVPLSTAQWSLTAALLSGAVSAPIMGRLGDGPHRRATLIGGLAVVTLGGVASALATSLGPLVLGRAMQGVGLGLVPLTMAAARDHLPRERVPQTIALLSVSAAAGVGAGYPLSGAVAGELGVAAAFWFGALVALAALAAAVAVVPRSRGRASGPLDVGGALVLGAGLVALLVTIAEGNAWGWGSAEVLGLLAAAAVLLAVWVRHQLRTAAPLVELRLLRRPAVLTGNACAFVLGAAMYVYLSLTTAYVQTPPEAGYGFGASVAVAGLCLVPFSILSVAAARAVPWLSLALGERAVLPLGCLVVSSAGAFFALFHGGLWEAFVMMGMVGVGLGATFAVIPGLVVGAVPERETGSAMGFYQVVRYVGFSLGSALAAALLASHTPAGARLPEASAYPEALWIAAGIGVVAAALAWTLPRQGGVGAAAAAPRLGEEDAELGSAGLVGVERPSP
jgi:MFS family permease